MLCDSLRVWRVRRDSVACVLAVRLQTLDQLNALCEPVVARLDVPLQAVLARCGLPMSAISVIEIVGGGMRPRCVKQRVAKVLGLPTADDHAGGYGLRCSNCVALL